MVSAADQLAEDASAMDLASEALDGVAGRVVSGLVGGTVAGAAAAFETAREIAGKSPDAIRAAKRILNDAVAVDAATGLMAESVEQQKLIGSPNQLEAVLSNLQKRAASYRD